MTTVDRIKEIMGSHRFAHGGYNGSAIAREIGVNPSTVTRVLRKLENDELVRPANGKLSVPGSHSIKGVSVLTDAEGNIKQQWVKTQAGVNEDTLAETLKDALENHVSKHTPIESAGHFDNDLLTIYPIADQHHGLLAWGKESGEDYDLEIGARILREHFAKIVGRSPNSKQAIVLNLGDYFHADNSLNMTPRGGNALDVDGRYFKIITTGVELMIDVVNMALQKHETVLVRNLPGNHDPHASVALTVALNAHFRLDKRVTIDLDPGEFFYHEFGLNLIGSNHGHRVKPDGLAAHMAVNKPEAWGRTRHRFYYFGHIHHVTAKEVNGVRVESFQTLAAKDFYHAAHGYSAGRSISSITLHKDEGFYVRYDVGVRK